MNTKNRSQNYYEVREEIFRAIDSLPEEECKALFKEMIARISNKTSITTAEENRPSTITELLKEFGIPAHIKGYTYLKEAIAYYAKYKERKGTGCQMTVELYPHVAEKFETTTQRVERAIRHAVETAWDRSPNELLKKYFGYTVSTSKGKPSNSEFIAMIVEIMESDN